MKSAQYHRLAFLIPFAIMNGCQDKPVEPNVIEYEVEGVFASGHIIMEEEYLLSARAEGYILASPFQISDTVATGDELFVLANPSGTQQLAHAQASYANALAQLKPNSPQQSQIRLQIKQAKSQLDFDKMQLDRYTDLAQAGAVAQVDFERVKTQYQNSNYQLQIVEKSLSDLIEQLLLQKMNAESLLAMQNESTDQFVLSAPSGGIILEVFKKKGELVRRGENLARLGSGRSIALLYIAEEDIQKIQIGQQVHISLNTSPEQIIPGKLTKIRPAFDNLEQSFLCEAQFPYEGRLLEGTRLQANIVISQEEIEPNALALSEVLLGTGTQF